MNNFPALTETHQKTHAEDQLVMHSPFNAEMTNYSQNRREAGRERRRMSDGSLMKSLG